MSSEVSRREAHPVPALVATPANSIGAEDIAVPRLYVGNHMTTAVQERRVNFGDIFLALGPDDTDPQTLWSLGSDDPGVKFHVLHLRKGKSYSDGGRLELYDYDDPFAPPDAWTTYNYTTLLPDVDPDMPARLLLTKSGRSTAQKINTVLMRNASQPSWSTAFHLTSVKRKNDKGEFAVAQVAIGKADAKQVKQAAELFAALGSSLSQPAPTPTAAPEI